MMTGSEVRPNEIRMKFAGMVSRDKRVFDQRTLAQMFKEHCWKLDDFINLSLYDIDKKLIATLAHPFDKEDVQKLLVDLVNKNDLNSNLLPLKIRDIMKILGVGGNFMELLI